MAVHVHLYRSKDSTIEFRNIYRGIFQIYLNGQKTDMYIEADTRKTGGRRNNSYALLSKGDRVASGSLGQMKSQASKMLANI